MNPAAIKAFRLKPRRLSALPSFEQTTNQGEEMPHVYGKRGRPPLKRGTMFFMTCPKTSKPGGPPRK